MKTWPFAVAIALLGGTWLLLASMSSAEPTVIRRPFSEFPLSLEGGWTGRDSTMDDRVLELLNLSDYVMRAYSPSGPQRPASRAFEGQHQQAAAPVWFYVGYYGSQRTGATYHSPKNCLPGGGWQFSEMGSVKGAIPGAPEVEINRVVIEKGFDRQLILYWYQDRGRVIASEYMAKAFLIWDATTRNRTDGALVRISTPIVGSPDEAYAHALAFLRASWEPLTRHLPG